MALEIVCDKYHAEEVFFSSMKYSGTHGFSGKRYGSSGTEGRFIFSFQVLSEVSQEISGVNKTRHCRQGSWTGYQGMCADRYWEKQIYGNCKAFWVFIG